MKSNNNYQPRKPSPDWLPLIFWGIVTLAIIAYCIEKIYNLFIKLL